MPRRKLAPVHPGEVLQEERQDDGGRGEAKAKDVEAGIAQAYAEVMQIVLPHKRGRLANRVGGGQAADGAFSPTHGSAPQAR